MLKSSFRGFFENPEGKTKAFYAKAWHTGDWVYGHLEVEDKTENSLYPIYDLYNTEYFLVSDRGRIKVAYESLGQDTEKLDIRGNHIYEDDIVAYPGDNFAKFVVCFTGIGFCLHRFGAIQSARVSELRENLEIVGSIYDEEAKEGS